MVLGQWKVHYYLVQFRRCGCCCGCCLLEILFSVGFMLSGLLLTLFISSRDGWTQSDLLVTGRRQSPLSCTEMLTKVEVPWMDTYLSILTSCRMRFMQLLQDD
jgi:hypothetical protein